MSRILARPRLTRIDEQVTVIHGLPGSGKTTVLDQIRASFGPTSTVSFPSVRDRIVVTVSAPADVVDAVGSVTIPEQGAPLGPDATEVLDRMAGVAAATVMCIDNAQPTNAAGEAWAVEHLRSLVDAGVRVVVAGRRMFSMPLREWRLQGRLCELDDRDLAFTLDELAEAVLGSPVDPPPWLVELHGRSAGWAATVPAARALHADHPRGPSARVLEQLLADLADHVTAHVVADCDDAERRSLLLAAVPKEISRGLAAEIGPPGAGQDLGALASWNPALVEVDTRPGWYRLHPLVAAGLRRELDVSAEVPVDDLIGRVADWHRREGQAARAIEMLIVGRRWDEAIELLMRSSLDFSETNTQSTFLALVDDIPSAVWDQNPRMILHYVLLGVSGGREAEAATLLARSPMTDHDLPPGFAAVADVMRSWLVTYSSPADVALAAAERALAVLQDIDESDLPEVAGLRARAPYIHLAERSAGRALVDLYRWPEALQRLRAVADDPGVVFLSRINAQGALALLHARRGELTDAARRARDAHEIAAARSVPDSYALAEANLALALVALWHDDADACRRALQDGRRQAERHRASAQLAMVACIDATLAIREGRPGDVAAILDAAPRRAGGVIHVWSDSLRARALARLGDRGAARQVLRRWALGPDTVVAFAETLAPGDPLDVSRAAWQVPDWPSARLAGALAEAIGEHVRGGDVRPALLDAIDIARPDRLTGAFAMAPAGVLAPLLDLAAPDPFEQELLVIAGVRGARPVEGRTGDEPDAESRSGGSSAPVTSSALTAREAEVLRALTEPVTLAEVAASLFMSPNTLKTHTRRIYRKLGVGNRAEAVALAGRSRLV